VYIMTVRESVPVYMHIHLPSTQVNCVQLSMFVSAFTLCEEISTDNSATLNIYDNLWTFIVINIIYDLACAIYILLLLVPKTLCYSFLLCIFMMSTSYQRHAV
jgi:hypothetical protein